MNNDLNKNNNILPLVIILIAIVLLFTSLIYRQYSNNNYSSIQNEEQNFSEEQADDGSNSSENDTIQYLTINPLQEYNYLSKKEIYDIRKKYVATSIFASKDYQPSEDVFGQIEDGKPWWGLEGYACHRGDNSYGVSQVSRFINNPAVLISPILAYGFRGTKNIEHFCNSDYTKFNPFQLIYNSTEKSITAKYKLHREVIDDAVRYGTREKPFHMTLVGVNAKDFGYLYMKISSVNDIEMVNPDNAMERLYFLPDYIHVGGSCGIDGGCNNISPYQPALDFYIKGIPATMEIKLWKNQPKNADYDTPDFLYRIMFEETFE